MAVQIDGASNKFILDTDADTYLEGATDDTIKVYVSGAEDLRIAANAINVLSGTTLTIDSGATITNSGTANGFGVSLANDANNRVVTGDGSGGLNAEANLTFDGTDVLVGGAGKVQLRDTGLYVASNADGDLDIVSDGTAVDSINLESAGGITLDAGTAGSGVIYEDDGTEMLRIHNSSSDVYIESKVSDKDIYLRGNDGGSGVNALKLDMSDAGAATLNNGLSLTDGNLVVASGHGIDFSATGDTSATGASTSSELLDDYEEGTWTPTVGGNASYHSQTGEYTKIGRYIYINCSMQINAIGTGSTTTVSGFPFSISGLGGSVNRWANLASNVTNLMVTPATTSTNFCGMTSNAGVVSDTITVFGSGQATQLQFFIVGKA